jgi:hypothetical protein
MTKAYEETGKVKDVENWPTLKQLNNKGAKRNGIYVFEGLLFA